MIEVMDVREARGIIEEMKPGDRLCYYVGFLLADRASRKVAALADFMLRAGIPEGFLFSEEGEPLGGLNLGYLTQRRVKAFCYKYYFTKAA